MATIGSLALAIRARTDQLKGDLKPALEAIKGWGEAARASGADSKEVERAMARMRAEALQGARSTGGLTDTLRKGRVAAASFAGAISSVSSEMGGAVGHVTRLGSSLTQSFLAGGPIALGVTAIAAAFTGVASAVGETDDALKASRDQVRAWAEDNQRAIDAVREQTRRLNDELAEMRGKAAPGTADENAIIEGWKERIRATTEAIREERRKIQVWTQEREGLLKYYDKEGGQLVGATSGEIAKRDQSIMGARQRIQGLEEDLAATKEKAAKELETLNFKRSQREEEEKLAQLAKDGEQAGAARVKQLREQLDATQEIVDLEQSRAKLERDGTAAARERASELMGIEAKRVKEEQEEAEQNAKKIQAESKKLMEEGKRRVDDQAKFKQGLRDELELLKAANEHERERVEIRRRLREDLEKAKGDAKAIADAQAIAAEKLADVAEREAAAAKAKADEEARATKEKEKQAQLAKEQVDITKRFANFGGKSPFGFGKGAIGMGLGDIGGAAGRASAAAGDIPGKGKAPPGAGPVQGAQKPPTDVSPKIEELIKTIQGWAALHEKTASGLDRVGAAAESAFDRASKATEKAITSTNRRVERLESKVAAHEAAMRRAGSSSGLGSD